MNAKELAALLDGREYGSEITDEEAAQAKAAGLVVAFGASDDLLEFRGAIYDEVGCYGGGSARVDSAGIIPDFNSIDKDDAEALRQHFSREKGGVTIDATWAGEAHYSWIISTRIAHESFEIVEDGDPYCRGIVFALADTEGAAQ